jgi:hypothetical protein
MIKLTQGILDHSKTGFVILSKNTPAVKVKFFHLRGPNNRPFVTICKLILKDGRTSSLGISICAANDNFSKKIGRDISFFRAMKALESKQSHFKINYDTEKEALKRFKNCYINLAYKSIYFNLILKEEW